VEAEEIIETLPLIRPPFISNRHYVFLGEYFTGARYYDALWMEAYVGRTEAGELEANDSPKHIMTLNELICGVQVRRS
jgi:hypothetical protein